MDGEKAALERQRAHRDQLGKQWVREIWATRGEVPLYNSGGGWLDADVVRLRVQQPVRMGLIERLWRKVLGR